MPQPLEGIRVLDLSMYLPGPFCTQILADFGAEVIKVEPLTGEWGRWVPPVVEQQSSRFYAVNRNKKSLAINLKTAAGQQTFLRLAETADVLLEQYRPGVLKKMGLAYEDLKSINPRLIYCSLTGYGHSGPWQYAAGHDINYLSLAGVAALSGNRLHPTLSAVQIADIAGGSLQAVTGILLALLEREKSGQGQFCDIAMLDGSVSLMSYSLAEWSGLTRDALRGQEVLTGGYACYNIYPTAGGGFISLGALEGKFWEGFCERIGRPEFVNWQWEVDRQDEMITAIQELMLQKDRDGWIEYFSQDDICLAPLLSLEEVGQHPQIQDRGMVIKHSLSSETEINIFMAGNPIKLSRTPGEIKLRFPEVGAHTREILSELGYSESQVQILEKAEIIRCTPA